MTLIVQPDGYAFWKTARMRCALGRGGISEHKAEGDGATPSGVYPFREVFYRADRISAPITSLPCRQISARDGWCDDPSDAQYNRHVTLPIDAGHEVLMRDDGLYDLLIVLGYNDDPVRIGRGSAIFLHVAAPDFSPTEGCVALALHHLIALTADIRPGDAIDIRQSSPFGD